MATIFLSFNIFLSGIKSSKPLPYSTVFIGIILAFNASILFSSPLFEHADRINIDNITIDINLIFFFILINTPLIFFILVYILRFCCFTYIY